MSKRRDALLLILLLALLAAGVWIVDARYRESRVADTVSQFQLLSTLRRSALETYLDTVRAEVAFWSTSTRIDESMQALSAGWNELGSDAGARLQQLYIEDNAHPMLYQLADAKDGSAYSRAHAELHEFAREFVTGRGYYDFFLLDKDGNIIYTVEKEADFATNLLDGPYSDTGLADVFRRAVKSTVPSAVALSDFESYAPSGGTPAIFAATQLTNATGDMLGVLALQLPTDTIAGIMHFTEGMGESGETYLVGSDLLMRSDSRFSQESTILKTRVDTPTVKSALRGERGVDYTDDYRGIEVLSAYDSLEFDGVRWAVMAEIDAVEIEQNIGNILGSLAAAAAAMFGLVIFTVVAVRDYVAPGGGASQSIDLDMDAS